MIEGLSNAVRGESNTYISTATDTCICFPVSLPGSFAGLMTSPAHGLVSGDKIFLEGASVDGERSRLELALNSATSTTIEVEDGTAFTSAVGGSGNATFQVRIDSEDMIVTDKVGDTLTVIRGANGTVPTTHPVSYTHLTLPTICSV